MKNLENTKLGLDELNSELWKKILAEVRKFGNLSPTEQKESIKSKKEKRRENLDKLKKQRQIEHYRKLQRKVVGN